ncbi:ABC transporter ATP-binding protein [Floricoccus penangensis]|uniref:ABC transporter domain-containing protein n=1 Tax=Floricoccus penangensis TaxID=1859475 RepID=A0A9Q5NZK8_9LACT|nr:ABC transporter ATP-binding protein [Floricoccus penangensis]OFI46703.1 hypothetical protein BG262_02580 [Floricoccus penangensis]URZ86745.1 ABC transporter ATP-binding protein [Floricoccus penangensis]
MTEILKINDLTFKRDRKTILRDVNLCLDSGKIVGLMGENASGKTTLISLIANCLPINSGEIYLHGEKRNQLTNEYVSYISDLDGFSKSMKIKDLMKFYKKWYENYDEKKAEELRQFLKLDLNLKISQMSKGTKEKAIIMFTMARKVNLYLLDEPLSGIDIFARESIIKALMSWFNEESTVIISSHHIDEIFPILDEIVVIDRQTVVGHENTEDLLESGMTANDYFKEVYYEKGGDIDA